jgi:hypothetical protein
MVPATWPPSPENEAKLAAYVAQHGAKGLQQAVSGGQCEFPDGLFYGGARASWSNTTLRAVLREHGARRRRIGWIDFHTGLGPRGHVEKIYSGRDVPGDLKRTKQWWGDDVTSFLDGSSTSATLSGVNYNAVYDECPGVTYAGVALEYGTVPYVETLQALRADQWLMNHPMRTWRCAPPSRGRYATRSIAMPTTGRRRCMRRLVLVASPRLTNLGAPND